MSSENQLRKVTDSEIMRDIQSEFLKRINKNSVKMELIEKKNEHGIFERKIKMAPMTTGDYIGIWAIAILKSLFLIFFVLMAYEIYMDIQAHIEISKSKVIIEMKNCNAEYEQNSCQENFLIESMAEKCKELEVCINQNVEMKVRTQQLWLQVLGNSFENLFKSLSIKASILISIIVIATSIIFIKN